MRLVLLLLASCALMGCPPDRGGDLDPGGDGDGGDTTTESSGAWVVITGENDGDTYETHSFVSWNRSGSVCTALSGYYADYADAYSEYLEESAALEQEWEDDPEAASQPDYRLRQCELYVDYYDSFYGNEIFSAGTEITYFALGSGDVAPEEGVYAPASDEDVLNADSFTGSRMEYLEDWSSPVADVDCEAYANDPEAPLATPTTEEDLALRSWAATQGALEVTAAGTDAWTLALTEGALRDGDGVETEWAFGPVTYARCDVSYPDFSAVVD